MRKAIIVAIDLSELNGSKREKQSNDALRELNQHLADGWNVVHSFPMSGTGHTYFSASVVILEKE